MLKIKGRFELPSRVKSDAYQKISQDTNWREAILTIWGRAWLYLEHTKDISSLGIQDDFIETLVTDPDLLDEIERLREIQGCPQY